MGGASRSHLLLNPPPPLELDKTSAPPFSMDTQVFSIPSPLHPDATPSFLFFSTPVSVPLLHDRHHRFSVSGKTQPLVSRSSTLNLSHPSESSNPPSAHCARLGYLSGNDIPMGLHMLSFGTLPGLFSGSLHQHHLGLAPVSFNSREWLYREPIIIFIS